jgi:hypothetical protein
MQTVLGDEEREDLFLVRPPQAPQGPSGLVIHDAEVTQSFRKSVKTLDAVSGQRQALPHSPRQPVAELHSPSSVSRTTRSRR